MFSWYKYLIVSLVFSHLGFWSGSLFLVAPFPDLCLLVPFYGLKDGARQLSVKEELLKLGCKMSEMDPKKSPRTSSIVRVLFSFWSFEISEYILRNQKLINGQDSFSNQCFIYLVPFRLY